MRMTHKFNPHRGTHDAKTSIANNQASDALMVDNFAPFYGDVQKKNHSVKVTMSFLIIMLIMVCTSVYAATNDTAPVDAQSVSAGQTSVKPDNIAEYAEQKINSIKAKDISLSEIANEITDPAERNAVQQAGYLQGDARLTGEYSESYYALDDLNIGLPPLVRPPNLSTPLATLEFFQSAIMKQQFDLAAYALNMNLLDSELQRNQSLELSRRLDFLLTKKELYVFDELPDRPDGLIEPPTGTTSSVMGIPRRSIQLGYMDYRERRVPIYLERVRVDDNAPIWVFSGQTVGNINNLYEQYQPAQFERYLPAWMKLRFFGISFWEFLALILFFSLTMGLGWLFSKGAGKLIKLYVSEESADLQDKQYANSHNSIADLVGKLTVPLTFTISFSLVFTLVSGGFPYIDAVATSTRPIVWIGLMFSAVWLGIRVINFFANRYHDLQIGVLDEKEFDKERRRRTYASIFRRVFIFIMIIGSFWIGLSEFTNISGLGTTLLTSAGIAGAVLGIAAQPILGNIIAGMQVAITQPIRIGDTVMMDDEWTTIEDLRYTYAVLKTWDERRLIVPMRHFVTETVENWSHTEVHQTCAVYLYVDYGADIDAIRQKYIALVKRDELWDGDTEPELITVSITETAIKLRGTVASDSPLNAWTLECKVREKMLSYLHQEQRAYLPTERLTFKDSH